MKYNYGYWEHQMDLIKWSGPDNENDVESCDEYVANLNQDGKLNFSNVNIDTLKQPMTWQEQLKLHVK